MSTVSARTATLLRHAANGRVGRAGFGGYACAGRPMSFFLYIHLVGLGLWEIRETQTGDWPAATVRLTDGGYAALGYDDLVDHRRVNGVRLVKVKITPAQRVGLSKVARWPWRDLDRRLSLIEHGWVAGHGLDPSIPAGSFRLTERGWQALGYDLDVEAWSR